MEWTGKGRRVVIYDLDGDEAAFRRFMSEYHAAWDEDNLAVPLQLYFRDQLPGRVLDVRPPAYEGGHDVYEVRPVEAHESAVGAGTAEGELPRFRDRPPRK
jgi:hypothetical protein